MRRRRARAYVHAQAQRIGWLRPEQSAASRISSWRAAGDWMAGGRLVDLPLQRPAVDRAARPSNQGSAQQIEFSLSGYLGV